MTHIHLCFLELQGRMLLAWQRLVQERPVPSLCLSFSHCWPLPRGFIPLSSPLPGSWPFRSRSNLRPSAPASVLSVVCVYWTSHWCGWRSAVSVSDAFFTSVVAVIVGGIDMMSQSLVLAKKPHIVIGKSTASISFHILQRFLHSLFLCVCVFACAAAVHNARTDMCSQPHLAGW